MAENTLTTTSPRRAAMEFTLGTLVVQYPKSLSVDPEEGKDIVTLEQILQAGRHAVDFTTQCVVDSSGHEYALGDEVPADTFLCVAPRDFSVVDDTPIVKIKSEPAGTVVVREPTLTMD